MDIYFLCDYCSDYICGADDYITCDCGQRWCSTRCARFHGYLNRKSFSSCKSCRNTDDDSRCNLFNLRCFVLDLVKDVENGN